MIGVVGTEVHNLFCHENKYIAYKTCYINATTAT
jgi:hypothetical protein